jgi:SAM-dependent methyltransferase
MRRAEKPLHLAPEYAVQFEDRSIVKAYAARPPYPATLFAKLGALLPTVPANALELGCGTGDLTFDLSPYVAELVAIEPSFEMLSAALKRHASVPRNVRFVLASAEKFEPRERFSLVVTAESLHWMDWALVLPKIARWLSEDGLLAIVTARSFSGHAWEQELRALIARSSTNQDYRAYDLIAELTQRGLFDEQGRERFAEPFSQSVAAYVESFHSRNGFSRERMGEQAALAFDQDVRALLGRHGVTDSVSGETSATLVWGRPLA